MQSVLVYSRQVARAVMGYIPYDASSNVDLGRGKRRMRLMTASCGFSKGVNAPNNPVAASAAVFNKKGIFGDDACFVARYKNRDVLGMFVIMQ